MFVKYEDFTHSPGKTLQTITKFLDLEYEPEILEIAGSIYDKTAQHRNMKIRQDQVRRPIRPNDGGWRLVFDEEQAMTIRTKVARVASQLGDNLDNL